MDKNTVIQCSEGILGGTPVFRGTRVPVKALIDYLEAGDDVDEFLRDFPTVTRGQTSKVLQLAKDDRPSESECH